MLSWGWLVLTASGFCCDQPCAYREQDAGTSGQGAKFSMDEAMQRPLTFSGVYLVWILLRVCHGSAEFSTGPPCPDSDSLPTELAPSVLYQSMMITGLISTLLDSLKYLKFWHSCMPCGGFFYSAERTENMHFLKSRLLRKLWMFCMLLFALWYYSNVFCT